MASVGQVLLLMGLALITGALLFLFMPKFQLPGDFTISAGSFKLYLPIATSLVLSILLTFALSLPSLILQAISNAKMSKSH
jgi:hypothetical protein